MNNNSGALSVDFLVGFTIFMIGFIWVASMIPNLFLGVSVHGIDYDAVAYRTGVILAEDEGAVSAAEMMKPFPRSWEDPTLNKDDVARFGLALSKDSPNILSGARVERFFCSTAFSYPDDYRTRAIFGDYPYQFNISLRNTDTGQIWSVGTILPDHYSYGYIRRVVKIKNPVSNATINATPYKAIDNTALVPFNVYSVMIDSDELLKGNVRDPAYQIIPQTDKITINITNLTSTMNQTAGMIAKPTTVNLSSIDFYYHPHGIPGLTKLPANTVQNYSIYVDGKSTPSVLPVNPGDPEISLSADRTQMSNVSLIFERGALSKALSDKTGTLLINLTFGINPAQEYLNASYSRNPLFNYTYTELNPQKGFVTPPNLQNGVLEVAVW